jgi:hypothetical protein
LPLLCSLSEKLLLPCFEAYQFLIHFSVDSALSPARLQILLVASTLQKQISRILSCFESQVHSGFS